MLQRRRAYRILSLFIYSITEVLTLISITQGYHHITPPVQHTLRREQDRDLRRASSHENLPTVVQPESNSETKGNWLALRCSCRIGKGEVVLGMCMGVHMQVRV